jgi:hypothetical protein
VSQPAAIAGIGLEAKPVNGWCLWYHSNQRNSIQQSECEVIAMSVARAIYDGRVFVPVAPVKARKNQEVFVAIVDEPTAKHSDNPLLRLAGTLSDEDYAEIEEALKDTEIVYASEW